MKAMDKILVELGELGFGDRKVLNALKKIKEELTDSISVDKIEDEEERKRYNKFINELLFNGQFGIEKPSAPLRGLRKVFAQRRGSRYFHYLLCYILSNDFFYKDYMSKTDDEKSNMLMYKIREFNPKVTDLYEMSLAPIKEPMIDYQALKGDIEDDDIVFEPIQETPYYTELKE